MDIYYACATQSLDILQRRIDELEKKMKEQEKLIEKLRNKDMSDDDSEDERMKKLANSRRVVVRRNAKRFHQRENKQVDEAKNINLPHN